MTVRHHCLVGKVEVGMHTFLMIHKTDVHGLTVGCIDFWSHAAGKACLFQHLKFLNTFGQVNGLGDAALDVHTRKILSFVH